MSRLSSSAIAAFSSASQSALCLFAARSPLSKACRERGEGAAVKVEGTMPATRKVEIRKQTRLFDDLFKVDEIVPSRTSSVTAR